MDEFKISNPAEPDSLQYPLEGIRTFSQILFLQGANIELKGDARDNLSYLKPKYGAHHKTIVCQMQILLPSRRKKIHTNDAVRIILFASTMWCGKILLASSPINGFITISPK